MNARQRNQVTKFEYSNKSPKYKYVYYYSAINRGKTCIMFRAWIQGKNGFLKTYMEEKEAAIAVDIFLISKGKEPVNILKRK